MALLPRPSPCPDGSLTFHAFNRGNNRQEGKWCQFNFLATVPTPCPDGSLTSRGNNRQDVFRADGDRLAYLVSFNRTNARYPFDLYAYYPMTNHVHLVLRPGPGQSIGCIMQPLAVAHTSRHHQRHAPSGKDASAAPPFGAAGISWAFRPTSGPTPRGPACWPTRPTTSPRRRSAT